MVVLHRRWILIVLMHLVVLLLLLGCGSNNIKDPKSVSTSARTAGVWVTSTDLAKPVLNRIDPESNAVVATIGLSGLCKGIAADGGTLWLSDYGRDKVIRVDAATNKIIATIAVGKAPGAITVGHGSVWVANSNEGTVSRIDPATDAVVSTIKITNSLVTGICVYEDAIWVTSVNMIVSKLDPLTNTVTGKIGVSTNPASIAGGFGSLWVGDAMGKKVLRLDPSAAKVAGSITSGNTQNILVDNDFVVASNYAEGSIVVINPQDNKVVSQIDVAKNLGSVVGGFGSLWAVNNKNNLIYRIDANSKTITPITVEKPGKIAITR